MPRNPNIKVANIQDEYTPEEIEEIVKCESDVEYFIERYVQIQHPKYGQVPFKLYGYQKEMIEKYSASTANIVAATAEDIKDVEMFDDYNEGIDEDDDVDIELDGEDSCVILSSRQSGKCALGVTRLTTRTKSNNIIKRMLLKLLDRNKLITNWCLGVSEASIEEIHNDAIVQKVMIDDDSGNLKFIEKGISDVEVLTPSGYSKIKHTLKTVKYQVHELILETKSLKCADTHIVIDSKGNERFVKDLTPDDIIRTVDGNQHVMTVIVHDEYEHMYDIELDDDEHIFYSNGILSHNTTVAAGFLLHFIMFNKNKEVLVVSNKNSSAQEVIARMKFMYEFIPMFLKPGVTDDGWNKHSLKFDNKSLVVSRATTVDSGRGLSISLLYCDELAFVPPDIQREFWAAVIPTLSTGGAAIVTSTPNGDTDLFSEIWRGAISGTNGFAHQHIKWNDPPGRGKAFRKRQISKIGMAKWRQEYLCEFLSGEHTLIDPLEMNRLQTIASRYDVVHQIRDIDFYEPIIEGHTYVLAVDPATGVGGDMSSIECIRMPSDNTHEIKPINDPYNMYGVTNVSDTTPTPEFGHGDDKLVQVLEYRSKTSNTNLLYSIMKNILNRLVSMKCEVYFTIESNGVGEGLLSLYRDDIEFPDAILISDQGKNKYGITTTPKTKSKAISVFKEMLTKSIMEVRSDSTINELKSYIRYKNTYRAQKGSTDDNISAFLLIIRIIEDMTSYNQMAYDKYYSNTFEEWEEDEWVIPSSDDSKYEGFDIV